MSCGVNSRGLMELVQYNMTQLLLLFSCPIREESSYSREHITLASTPSWTAFLFALND